jgi:hypothetical protein
MDGLTNNSALLEFDLNDLTARDFCEVFAMDSVLARRLHEYRMETIHVFKFDQLLKLKDIDEEALEKWKKPDADANVKFGAEFQRSLGLPSDIAQPIPVLLEAICKATNAEAGLMSRKGEILLQYPKEATSLGDLGSQLREFFAPVQENLVQLNSHIADLQVIGLDKHDLLLLPTSGFCIAVVQQLGNINAKTLGLWRSFSGELKLRYPPKIIINNHATTLETDIAFDCPHCRLRIVLDQAGAGYAFPCPRCKIQVTAPPETTSFSSFIESSEAKTSA